MATDQIFERLEEVRRPHTCEEVRVGHQIPSKVPPVSIVPPPRPSPLPTYTLARPYTSPTVGPCPRLFSTLSRPHSSSKARDPGTLGTLYLFYFPEDGYGGIPDVNSFQMSNAVTVSGGPSGCMGVVCGGRGMSEGP